MLLIFHQLTFMLVTAREVQAVKVLNTEAPILSTIAPTMAIIMPKVANTIPATTVPLKKKRKSFEKVKRKRARKE